MAMARYSQPWTRSFLLPSIRSFSDRVLATAERMAWIPYLLVSSTLFRTSQRACGGESDQHINLVVLCNAKYLDVPRALVFVPHGSVCLQSRVGQDDVGEAGPVQLSFLAPAKAVGVELLLNPGIALTLLSPVEQTKLNSY